MVEPLKVDFQAPGPIQGGDLVVFVGDDLKPAPAAAERIGPDAVALIARAATAEQFKGKAWSTMTLAAPSAPLVDRMIVIGIGGEKERAGFDWARLGGVVAGKVSGRHATLLAEFPGLAATPENLADIALGARLRHYSFDRYKTRKDDAEAGEQGATRLTLAVPDPAAAHELANRLGIPSYDAAVVGYPKRMRDYNERRKRAAN